MGVERPEHKRKTALERAEEDIERGDLGLARMRLTSYLNSRNYDPALLDRIAQICLQMRDLNQAGRYWFAAKNTDAEAEEAIAAFLSFAGQDPGRIVAQIPRAARLWQIEDYPDVVRQRLQEHGLEEAMIAAARADRCRDLQATPGSALQTFALSLTFVLILLIIVVVISAGLYQIGTWLFG